MAYSGRGRGGGGVLGCERYETGPDVQLHYKMQEASQTDVTFNERNTRGGNRLMDGYKVSQCNPMSLKS